MKTKSNKKNKTKKRSRTNILKGGSMLPGINSQVFKDYLAKKPEIIEIDERLDFLRDRLIIPIQSIGQSRGKSRGKSKDQIRRENDLHTVQYRRELINSQITELEESRRQMRNKIYESFRADLEEKEIKQKKDNNLRLKHGLSPENTIYNI
jgi:hypothetical protein